MLCMIVIKNRIAAVLDYFLLLACLVGPIRPIHPIRPFAHRQQILLLAPAAGDVAPWKRHGLKVCPSVTNFSQPLKFLA